ncbi:hypothetical protein [Streptomyces daghestanicus]|uniref:Uncharacterized protein n=1 Tax=Streptomyces coeruleofuscus TaxID=66879 RepID=A0ABP5VG44_9ACTN
MTCSLAWSPGSPGWVGCPFRPLPGSEPHALVLRRPFGFLAVHRETRLVLAAGRVTDPKPFPEDEDAYLPDTSGD